MSKENTNNGFYKHEKFGNVPNGWDVTSVKECFDFFPVATYSRSVLSETGDCAYIHYGDIHTKFNRFIDLEVDELPYVPKYLSRRFTKIQEGDLVIADASEDYEGVGKAVEVVNVKDKQIIAGLHTLHLRTKNGSFINGFKGYLLNQEKVRLSILRSATGIKVYSISKSGLKKILLPKPPKPEQIAITAILSKVDDAILSIEQSIKAAEKLKTALMQNLLTGKLKPDGTWRKEDDFEMTKIGYIPKAWTIKSIKELSIQVTDGEHTTPIRAEIGFYLLSARNIKNGYLALEDVDFVPEFELRRIQKRCNPQEGDILISCSGTIGNVCKVPKGLDAGMVRSAALVKLKKDEFEPDFAELMLHSFSLQNQMKVSVASSVQGNLFQGAIRKLKVPYPLDKNERDSITKEISVFSNMMQEKNDRILKLQRLKKALMQNLLTGKIRLKPELISELNKTMNTN